MKIPYLAHIPFVLLFLMFVLAFVVRYWASDRTTKRR
jgi:hypothetical protein